MIRPQTQTYLFPPLCNCLKQNTLIIYNSTVVHVKLNISKGTASLFSQTEFHLDY